MSASGARRTAEAVNCVDSIEKVEGEKKMRA